MALATPTTLKSRIGAARFSGVSLLLVLLTSTAVFPGITNAQTTNSQTPPPTQDALPDTKPEIKTLPPAYEPQLMRLAEVLGALHYLRALCGEDEGQMWRKEMETLIEVEEPTEVRKAQLIAHFNRGFRGYAEIYRECTKPAAEAANQFLQQGARLSAEIPNRFGR